MFAINVDPESGNFVLDVRCDHCNKDHQLLNANRQPFVVAFATNQVDRMLNRPIFLCRQKCLDAVKNKRSKEGRPVLAWGEWGELTGLFEST